MGTFKYPPTMETITEMKKITEMSILAEALRRYRDVIMDPAYPSGPDERLMVDDMAAEYRQFAEQEEGMTLLGKPAKFYIQRGIRDIAKADSGGAEPKTVTGSMLEVPGFKGRWVGVIPTERDDGAFAACPGDADHGIVIQFVREGDDGVLSVCRVPITASTAACMFALLGHTMSEFEPLASAAGKVFEDIGMGSVTKEAWADLNIDDRGALLRKAGLEPPGSDEEESE